VAALVPQVAGNVVIVPQFFGSQGDLQRRAAKVVETDRVVKDHWEGIRVWVIPTVGELEGCHVYHVGSVAHQADLVLDHSVI